MTIAAGKRCSNGIVLATDTEFTHGAHKSYGTKIANFVKIDKGFFFIMAGAGNAIFMEKVFDTFADKLEKAVPQNIAKAVDTLENVLIALYKRHIFKIPNWSDVNHDASFLFAIRTPNGEQDFFRTSNTVVAKASDYECIGSGEDVGSSVIESFAHPNSTVAEAVVLLTHAIQRVKDHSLYCGGATVVIIQEASGIAREEKFTEIAEIENCLRDLQMEFTAVILAWADDSLSEDEFHNRVMTVTAKVTALRNKFLRDRESWNVTTQQLIDHVRGKPLIQKS
jgi:20S proteasome alpha/beta subunit